ncbi:MAG: glycosyltransferase family 87 protein [Myxococcota bacterium]|nr:glycosyltransferase family 87 protein [Myxococcota bacterium]
MSETPKPAPWWLRHLLALPPALVALWVAWLVVGLALQRLDFPFDIEWMEGGMLVHALRIEQGQPLYAAPSPDWVPYIYPPFYPWLISALGEPSYLLGRSISLVGTLAAAAAGIFALWREGRSPLWGLAAAGLYLSCYDESGTFYELVRTDALAMGLLTWSLVLCRTESRGGVVAGGLLLVLAFLTKHNFALFGVGIVGWLFWRDRKLALLFAAASVIPALVLTGAIQIASDGNYLTYLLGVPGSHPLNAERAFPLSEKEMLAALILSNLAALGILAVYAVRKRWSAGGVYWGVMTGIALVACVLMRAHHGGFINVLMPGHWVMAIGGTMLVASVAERSWAWGIPLSLILGLQGIEGRYKYDWKHGPKDGSLKERICLLDANVPTSRCFQDRWDPGRLIPDEDDLAAGNALIAQLSEIQGSVFAPQFPWYPYLAGKEPSFPLIALWDIQHKRGPLYQEPSVMTEGFQAHRWDAVLCADKPLKYGFQEDYLKAEKISWPQGVRGTAMRTRTGWRVKPAWIWRPKDTAFGQGE